MKPVRDFEILKPIHIYGNTYYIDYLKIQKKRHRKKRIDKKWRNRYGYHVADYLPEGKLFKGPDGTMRMSRKTFAAIRVKNGWYNI